jgi:hypothetical protein
MGRHNSTPDFYPPRAGWSSGILSGWDACKRRLRLDWVHLPSGISFRSFVVSLLIPGWGFRARGGVGLAGPVMAMCAVLALAFVVFLGRPLANLAFGLLLAAHTVSVYYLVLPLLQEARYRFRFVFILVLLTMFAFAGYLPIRDYLQSHWLMPLSYHGHVVVVNRKASPSDLHVGDVAAYQIEGDLLVFTPNHLLVNGVAQPRRPQMPVSGEFSVPEKYWFIWPDFDISNRGNVSTEAVASAMVSRAIVSPNQLVGKPFARWFHRRQLPL